MEAKVLGFCEREKHTHFRALYPVISDEQLRNLNITVNAQFCGHISDPPALGASMDVTCARPSTGTFVKIQTMKTSVLNIGEDQLIFTSDGC